MPYDAVLHDIPEELHLTGLASTSRSGDRLPTLSRRLVVVMGFVLGLAIWLVPSTFLGHREPWDGNGPWYAVALVAAGIILGFLGSGHPFSAVVGVFLGQVVVLLSRVISSPETSELWLVGVVMLGGYTFVATGIGAGLGALGRRKLAPVSRSGDRRSH
jgi:hypothetical protein